MSSVCEYNHRRLDPNSFVVFMCSLDLVEQNFNEVTQILTQSGQWDVAIVTEMNAAGQ